MNKKNVLGRLVAIVAVAAGLSFVSTNQASAKIVTESDGSGAQIQTSILANTVSSASDINATGSASLTPASKRWKSSTITYKISSGSSYYKSVWKTAVSRWNKSGVIDLVPTKGKADITLSTANAKSSTNGTVGITYSSYYNNSTIHSLKVMASAKSYVYRNVASRYKYSKAERAHVAEHELGHALGLQHNVGKASVMYYATRSQSVSKPDVNGLKQSYR